MTRIGLIVAVVVTLMAGTASAADLSSGSGALALAALVGAHSPQISAANKRALAFMLDGRLSFYFAAHGQIVVKAASVSCRSSDVDISAHSCTLKFGAARRTLAGRPAHELYATLIENGVKGDGAAGSIFEAVSSLDCTIKVAEVKERGGGGATCTASPGP